MTLAGKDPIDNPYPAVIVVGNLGNRVPAASVLTLPGCKERGSSDPAASASERSRAPAGRGGGVSGFSEANAHWACYPSSCPSTRAAANDDDDEHANLTNSRRIRGRGLGGAAGAP